MQQRIINRVEGDDHYRNALSQSQPPHDNTPGKGVGCSQLIEWFIRLCVDYHHPTDRRLFSVPSLS